MSHRDLADYTSRRLGLRVVPLADLDAGADPRCYEVLSPTGARLFLLSAQALAGGAGGAGSAWPRTRWRRPAFP